MIKINEELKYASSNYNTKQLKAIVEETIYNIENKKDDDDDDDTNEADE